MFASLTRTLIPVLAFALIGIAATAAHGQYRFPGAGNDECSDGHCPPPRHCPPGRDCPPPNGRFPDRGFPNPIIADTGPEVSDYYYDPFLGRRVLRTDRTKVLDSALDPNRNHIDPGSYEVVDETYTDRNGVEWHLTGERWTSYGKEHANLNRRRLSNLGGGTIHDENEMVIRNLNGKAGNRSQNLSRSRPPTNRSRPQSLGSSRQPSRAIPSQFQRSRGSYRPQSSQARPATPRHSNPQIQALLNQIQQRRAR